MSEENEQIDQSAERLTAAQLLVRLKVRYPAPEFALIPNVADALGVVPSRRADAVAMGLWLSHGHDMQGFELKSSRADWLREKKNPSKSDAIAKYCDRWWLVLGHASIAKEGEVPPSWGILVPHGAGLRVARQAVRVEARALDKPFIAALLRAAYNNIDRAEVEAEVELRVAKAKKEMGKALERQQDAHEQEIAGLRLGIGSFEERSGVSISKWNAGEVGHAVRCLVSSKFDAGRLDRIRERLIDLAGGLALAVDEYRHVSAVLDAVPAASADARPPNADPGISATLRRVIVESPYRGGTPEEVERNVAYARAAMTDSLLRGEAPMLSHLLYTQVLDDTNPKQREAGIEASLAWGQVAAATVVYGDLGITEGMQQGINRAQAEGRPVVHRTLGFAPHA